VKFEVLQKSHGGLLGDPEILEGLVRPRKYARPRHGRRPGLVRAGLQGHAEGERRFQMRRFEQIASVFLPTCRRSCTGTAAVGWVVNHRAQHKAAAISAVGGGAAGRRHAHPADAWGRCARGDGGFPGLARPPSPARCRRTPHGALLPLLPGGRGAACWRRHQTRQRRARPSSWARSKKGGGAEAALDSREVRRFKKRVHALRHTQASERFRRRWPRERGGEFARMVREVPTLSRSSQQLGEGAGPRGRRRGLVHEYASR